MSERKRPVFNFFANVGKMIVPRIGVILPAIALAIILYAMYGS